MPRSRSLRRLVTLALCLLVGLELVYLAGANGFLRSAWGRQALNRRPERLTVAWRSAWSWLPGVLHVRELEIRGRARRALWATSLDRGRMIVLLPALLGRHFRLLAGEARGAEIEVRVLPPPPATGQAPARRRPWRVSLDELTIEPLRRFQLDDYELRGAGRVAGRARFAVRGPAEIKLDTLAFDDGALFDAGAIAAESLRLDGRLHLAPFVVGEATLAELMAGLDGRLTLDGEASSLGFLAAYLERVPWLRLGGSGHLTAELEASAGWLAPGSRITLDGPRVAAELFGLRATGEGSLVGRVPEGADRTELTLRLPHFALARQRDQALLVEGEDLELVVTNDSAAIDRPAQEIALALELPPARAPDLAAFSPYLPPATGLTLTGGSAELAASLRYSTTARSGDGWLRLRGRQVAATFHDVDLRADVLLDGRLADARLEDGSIDISGSRLDVSAVRTREGGRLHDSGWWGRIRLPRGRLVTTPGEAAATLLEGELAAELRDTGPLVALLRQHLPRLVWLDRLLTVHGVAASSRVRLQGQRFSLADLEVAGGKKGRLEILGQLDLVPDDPAGVLFARWGRLSAAVSLAAGERDWKLTRSRRWYERRAAAYRASRAAAGAGS